MVKRRIGWVSLFSFGLLVWLWAMRQLSAEAPPTPTFTPSATPPPAQVQLAPQARPPVALGEEPDQPRQLKTNKPPPPKRQRLKVAPPPPPPTAPPPPPEKTPQLPQSAYPQAGQAPLPLPDPIAFQPAPPAELSPSAYVARAEGASQQLDQLIRSGRLRAEFLGTGHAGVMVEMNLVNNSNRSITVQLHPGMILRPGDGQKVQPLMVDEESTITLAPGQSTVRPLQSYCMDSRVPAPGPSALTPYRFSTRTKDGGADNVRVFQIAQQLPMQPSNLPESYHRQAVTQLAIWRSLRQPAGETQQQSAMGPAYFDRPTRQAILADVDRVLRAARQ